MKLCQFDANIKYTEEVFQMQNQVTFSDLSAHLYGLIKSESYSKSTAKDMSFILKAFSTYMTENGLEEYTPEIGELLIRYCEQDLHVCPSRVSRDGHT